MTNPNGHGPIARAAALAAVLATTFSLSGCFGVRTFKVPKTVVAPHVMSATLEQLDDHMRTQYAAVKTINAKVTITASTGGAHQGEVAEIPSFSGFMLLRKPSDLLVLLQLPVVSSLALEMVADGKTFKLLVPGKKIAREGSEEILQPSAKGFENLRPNIIRDALQVPPVGPDEFVSETQDSRILPPLKGRKESTEEPDYDLTITRIKKGHELQTIRLIHVSRVTLEVYEQDIYDKAGNLVEIVKYDRYQKFGAIDYPMSIQITMPMDEFAMKIEVTKLTLNQEMDDEQFALKFPDNLPVQKMP